MRGVALVVLLTACNAGGLAFDDARVGDDVVIDGAVIDGAVIDGPGIDGAVIDAEMLDAEIHDANVLYDAEIHDANVDYDAEIHDANVDYDAEIHDAEPPDADLSPDAHDPLVPSLTMVQLGFAGSYTVSPPGTPCGPGCSQYATPTDVTVDLTLVPGGNLSWGVGPCVLQAHNPTCTVHVDGELVQEVDFFCPTFVVDVVNGSDSNPGTCGAAFKTITKAAGLAHGFQIIRVLPGTYSDATETFPITLPTGTPLWGAELAHGSGIVITTNGARAVVCGDGSDIAGITVSAPNGVAVTGGVPCLVRDSVIHDSVTGVESSAAVRIERNTIRDNATGVSVLAAGADLGNASAYGGNDLVCNGVADVSVGDGFTASAVGCTWDHEPPSAADVVLGAGAALDVLASTLSENACP